MTYVTYSRTGPFVDNGSPPIDHVFLNSVETFLAAGWFDSLIISDGSGHLTLANNVAYRAKDSGGTGQDILKIDGSNKTDILGVTGTDQILIRQAAGTTIATFSSGGIALNVGTVALLAGSISRITAGVVSTNSSGATVTHGLGATPDVVLLTVENSSTSEVVSWNGLTSTQFTAWTNNATLRNVHWLAMKA